MGYDVKEIFNSPFALFYEKVINRISSPLKVNRWRKTLVKDAFQEVSQPKIIVDFCSGAGNIGEIINSLNLPFSGSLINCDISKPLLKLGKERLKEAFFLCADNRFFPLKDFSVDLLFSSFCIRNSLEPLRTVREVKRVLRVGGVWGILDFFRLKEKRFASTFNDFIFRSFMKLNSCLLFFHKEKEAIDYLFYSIEKFYSVEGFVSLLEEEGFEVKYVRNFMGGIANTLIAVKEG